MQIDVLRDKWKKCKNELNDQWGQLTSDDLETVNGRRDKLVLILERRYGYAHRRAEKEVELFVNELEDKLRKAS